MKDPDRARLVKALIDKGYLERITISEDLIRRLYLKCYRGHGYDYLLRHFVPMLEAAGVTSDEIDTILIKNPRRIFS